MTPTSSSRTRTERHPLWLIALSVGALGAAAFAFAGDTTPSHRPMSPPAVVGLATSPSPSASARVAVPLPVVAKPMGKSVPTRLRISAIGVDSELMPLGLNDDGTLETPPGAFPAGWFTGAPTPGELGPAIIVGHVRYNTPGVFERLTDLRLDDRIAVKRVDGSTATFRVTKLVHFAKSKFPTQEVYGNIDHAGLRLITCGGLDASTNEYRENLVVFAELVAS